MKKIVILAAAAFCSLSLWAQKGYAITVTLKPFKNTYVYLGHYLGKQLPIIDSALLDDNSTAIFKGNQSLNKGIYLIGYPGKAGFFEILMTDQQTFSITADTATIKNKVEFINNPDNLIFQKYQLEMRKKGERIQTERDKLAKAGSKADSTSILQKISAIDGETKKYREQFIVAHPNHLLSGFLKAMREPELPGDLLARKTRADSIAAYQYVKKHFWDETYFWDGSLAYTPFFENKLDKYFTQYVALQPDSVIKELDAMLVPASINDVMNKFLLIKFINRYLSQKYMWEDAIFVHLYESYIAHIDYPWLNEEGRKTVTNRAYSLMRNIFGKPAEEISLPDSTGKAQSLYADTTAELTLVCFWDPTCGHCKEVLPKLDSLYNASWKQAKVKIFAVAKETDGTPELWKNFITTHHLTAWQHVYYSRLEESKRVNNNIPGYIQLYDVQTFPSLYLLDKEKRIIAKKLNAEQISEIIALKLKEQH